MNMGIEKQSSLILNNIPKMLQNDLNNLISKMAVMKYS